jgi:hypothetical protein
VSLPAAIGIVPAGSAARTWMGPAEPVGPLAWVAARVTVSASVSRAKVTNSPETSGPDAGDQVAAPAGLIATVAPSAGTGFP